MKKEFLAATVALALSVTAFSGCSDNSKEGDGAGTTAATAQTTVTSAEAVTAVSVTTDSEAETDIPTLSDDELAAKLNEVSEYITGKFSKATLNRIYDQQSILVSTNLERTASVLIRVKEAGDIANVAFEASEIYREALSSVGFDTGVLSVNTYEKDDKGIIDETMIAWRSADGLTGELADGVNARKIEECTIEGLYEYFGDQVKPFTSEEAADFIKTRINKKSEGLIHEEDNAVLVSAAGGGIAVSVRTYEEFLIPAAAEYAYAITMPIVEKSELPFSRINVNVYDNDEKGGIVQETMVGWTTRDGATGRFTSHVENIDEESVTLEALYEKYSEYAELIEKAKNGERIDVQ